MSYRELSPEESYAALHRPAVGPTQPKGTAMTDTTNVRDFTETLGSMTHSVLIRLGSAVDLLLQADAAFKAGDDEKGKRYVNNAAAAVGDTSIQLAVDASYPRSGDQISGA